MLSYQKLDVYQCAIEFLALAALIVSRLPRGYSFLADELKRADRSRYFGIARGSAMECGAILDACAVLGLAGANTLKKGADLLERIVSMLPR